MRPGSATRHERLMRLHQRNADKSASAGLTGVRFSDLGDGSTITVEGRRVANFGSCSYLGLSVDERLKRGAIEAVERFGPHYSSSQTYSAVDLYPALEELLGRMTDAPSVVLPPTTTLGHLACLPTLVGEGDAVVLDSQSHASLQLTMQVLAGRGLPVYAVPHNSFREAESKIASLSSQHRHVWYVGDGVYSMFGDFAPVRSIVDLMDVHDNLYAYLDDAHGFSWLGLHGRGYVLSNMALNERTVVAAGTGKAFGSGGAALLFGDPDLGTTVRRLGGPMVFSGPIQPPILGASVASAHIHLSEEHVTLRARMIDQIQFVATRLAEQGLPVMSWSQTPIWMIRVGNVARTLEMGTRLLQDGFFVNVTGFPAVPVGMEGLRFTHTLNNTASQISDLVERLGLHYREVVGEPEVVIDLNEMELAVSASGPVDR